jgi:hypothetical protein
VSWRHHPDRPSSMLPSLQIPLYGSNLWEVPNPSHRWSGIHTFLKGSKNYIKNTQVCRAQYVLDDFRAFWSLSETFLGLMDVMITIFFDFDNFRRKNWRFLNQCHDQIFRQFRFVFRHYF